MSDLAHPEASPENSGERSHWPRTLLGAAVFGVLMWLSLSLGRDSRGSVAPIAPATAIALAMILRHPPRDWLSRLAGCFIVNLVVGVAMGRNLPLTFSFALTNMGEVLLVAGWLWRWRGRGLDFAKPAHLASFALASLSVPWAVAVVASPIVWSSSSAPVLLNVTVRGLAHGLGFVILTPALILLQRKGAMIWSPARRRDALMGGLVLVLGLAAVFGQSRYPVMFLALPPILLMAFQFELEGAALAILVTAMISTLAAVAKVGPTALNHGSMTERILILQLFLATCSLAVLPVASVLAQRRIILRSMVEARDEAIAAQARYRLLAEHSSDIIVRTGPDGIVRYCSPAIRAQGYEPEEIVGRSTFDLMHPDDLQAAAERRRQRFSGAPIDPSQDRQMRLRTKSGEYRWFEGAPSVIYGDKGQALESITVLRDVTTRRQMEEDLRAAKEEAEAASQVKSDFLANMSHELRTPLTAIIGFAGLLAVKGKLGEMEAMFVKRIGDASRSLLALINDVLDLSKVEAGHVDLERAPVDLRNLAREVAALMDQQAKTKGLVLSVQVADDVPGTVLTDITRLRQVVTNLLSNAVKFTEAGSAILKVARSGPATLRFEVTDTGAGIPADRLDRLFTRFVQADSSTTRLHGGTGLGLAICKGIVDLMHGRIGVESIEGSGSTFWFEIPLIEASADGGGVLTVTAA
ncbi:MAG TPA: ATP-binding protein [Caulobacteraceae bacterium]